MRDVSPARDRRVLCMVEISKGSKNKYEYDPALGGVTTS
jgi:hypothetical protein